MKRGYKFVRNFLCAGLDNGPCQARVSRPNVRCASCHEKYEARKRVESGRKARDGARFFAAHPDRVRASHSLYYQTHKDKVLAYTANYQKNHRVEHNQWNARWAKANPEYRRAVTRRRRANANASLTVTDRVLSVEYRKAITKDLCFYCGAVGREDDHYVPLAIGGTDHWWNLVRACKICNRRKGKMHGDMFRLLEEHPRAA